MRIGIFIFDGVEELDFVGPCEVFGMSNEVHRRIGVPNHDPVYLVAEEAGSIVRGAKGMRVIADEGFASAGALDVLVVPGGEGTRRLVEDPATLAWLRAVAPGCTWVSSVCTGAFLLGAAGLTREARVTTHWSCIQELRASGLAGEVVDDERFVADGRLVTAAGVSAGLDMALWLVGQMHGPGQAQLTQHAMEYYPEPPFADVPNALLPQRSPSGPRLACGQVRS